MDLNSEIFNKPRSISFNTIDSFHQGPSKLVPLDLKKIREERLINKTSTPKYSKNTRTDTIFKVNSIEEQWKQYKSVGKLKPEENKLIFSKDTRPKSAIRGMDDTSELLKIAECTAGLFSKKKTLETVQEITPVKKLNPKLNKSLHQGSATQRVVSNSHLINAGQKTKKEIPNTKSAAKIKRNNDFTCNFSLMQ